MKAYCWLLFALLMQLGNVAGAQTACPPGMEVYGEGVCGYSRLDEPAQQDPPQRLAPPPQQWADKWMAIATDSKKGSLGTAIDKSSRAEAEQVAMADCRAKGGLRCKFENAYRNGCGAIAVGDKGYNVNGAATLDEANQLAMKTCSADGDPKCHVYYSACSLPVRIR